MKKIIFDTSFIISAVKNKIDIFEEIPEYEVIIPEQVLKELQRQKSETAELAFKILEKNKFRKVDLGKGHVDKLLVRFAKENPEAIVATLDREIKKKVKNNKLVIRGKKRFGII